MTNTFDARSTLSVNGADYEIFRIDALQREYDVARLPYSLKILLENLLRHENGVAVTADQITALAKWNAAAPPATEIAYTPSRVLLQDFTGVPAMVDLAAMRDAMRAAGGDASKINPLQPVELVIDHSVMVDFFGSETSLERNLEREYQRNGERYAFLRWCQEAFDNFKAVPPGSGIVHQVNLEYLARVVFSAERGGRMQAYPDTLVGTDSHTTMINGLGVLGWGVGGIEAEAAMLGQPVSMLIPQVVGFRLSGDLGAGTTATDLVLTVTEMLRSHGVVGKFVEFYGPSLHKLPLADRATIGNMSPEYGATCGIFPVDAETIRYMRFTGRSEEQLQLVERYMREQGMFHDQDTQEAVYSDVLELDLSEVEPCIAGPRRPQDRIPLRESKVAFSTAVAEMTNRPATTRIASQTMGRDAGSASAIATSGATATIVQSGDTDPCGDERHGLTDGSVVIAAITSCTNTSNPSVMLAAGLLAKKAIEKGLTRKPWVKTSLAPGSKVVTRYYEASGLDTYLEQLGFNLVGYGCTTCIGNSGPLPPEVSAEIAEKDLATVAVLSGNRNFEARINPEVKMNYLASPPLVVLYSLVGHMDFDPYSEPIGTGSDGEPVYMADIWPSRDEIEAVVESAVQAQMFRSTYDEIFEGDVRWRDLPIPTGDRFEWGEESTYIRRPPYFDDMPTEPTAPQPITGARVLAMLGDSITTDHISPAGAIKIDGPAGHYLTERGIAPRDFNSYGSRRGNHEVMIRGTFANVRLRNLLAPGTEGGLTLQLPEAEEMSIYDASMRYQADGVPLIVLAGKEYGSGSSRDWAAKGTTLLGVRAVIAESYERIHRSNLVGMGVLPLQFCDSASAASLGLTGRERFDIDGVSTLTQDQIGRGTRLRVTATDDDGATTEFDALLRIDTPQELHYFTNGGILQYVLRSLRA